MATTLLPNCTTPRPLRRMPRPAALPAASPSSAPVPVAAGGALRQRPLLSACRARRGLRRRAGDRLLAASRGRHPRAAARASRLAVRAKADDGEEEEDALASEEAGARKRTQESAAAGVQISRPPRGGDPPPPGPWTWTLNWDPIVSRDITPPQTNAAQEAERLADPLVLVGSCPRLPEDVDRLVDEAGVEAILCLQSDACFEALGIEWEAIRQRALARGVLMVRVAVRDFDRLDQAQMLPEMVRMLGALAAMDKRTYVHCTAGINRANLTVVGFLTFVRGMALDDAMAMVREARPQANPYAVSWQTARARLLAGREQDLYLQTQLAGNTMDDGGDWLARDWSGAEVALIQQILQRQIDVEVATLRAVEDMSKMQAQQQRRRPKLFGLL